MEWGSGIFTKTNNDVGDATYTIEGTQKSFQVLARVIEHKYNLQIYLENLEITSYPKGSMINLEWVHNGCVNFILFNASDGIYYMVNPDGENWMKNRLAQYGKRMLKEICIPGSHDAGMSVFGTPTTFAKPCNTITQTYGLGKQLSFGMRYFDIRPVISKGKYYTGHYGYINMVDIWQGVTGQSIESIVNEINSFIEGRQELIILQLSHSHDTDTSDRKFPVFNQNQWDALFTQLDEINCLYHHSLDTELQKLTLNDYIEKQCAILLIVPDEVNLGKRYGKGYYSSTDFQIYNKYSDTNHLNYMVHDQLNKMEENFGKTYFLLSWTLTLSDEEAATCLFWSHNIRYHANIAVSQLVELLLPYVTPELYQILSTLTTYII